MVGILLNEGVDDIKLYVQSSHAQKLKEQFALSENETFEKVITKELENEQFKNAGKQIYIYKVNQVNAEKHYLIVKGDAQAKKPEPFEKLI